MASSEIIEILKNDGFIYCDQMVLTNFVSKGNDHILMFGTWFDTERSGYGNERRVYGKTFKRLGISDEFIIWELGDLTLKYFGTKDDPDEFLWETFRKVQAVKKRLNYDFDAAQKNIMQKFENF